jgi:hypothetical protein
VQNAQPTPLALVALESRDQQGLDRVELRVYLKSAGRKKVTRLSLLRSLEASVTAISWEVMAADTEDAPLTSEPLIPVKAV